MTAASFGPGIRQATNDDAETIAQWLTQPQITAHLSANLRASDITAPLIRAALRRRDQLWAIFTDAQENPLGLIALDQIDPIDSLANIWYLLGDPSRSRQGLTSTALCHFLDSNPMQLNLVTAWTGAPNLASRHCLQKIGFREVGRLTGAFIVKGQRHDRILFEKKLSPA